MSKKQSRWRETKSIAMSRLPCKIRPKQEAGGSINIWPLKYKQTYISYICICMEKENREVQDVNSATLIPGQQGNHTLM
jgi:hypothetical protein